MAAAAKTYPDFGKWLTYKEAIYSATAIKEGIDNTPDATQYARMVYTYKYLYAPLCEHFGFKLPINSFFRCKALNDAVGGSTNSEHMKGGAIDFNLKKSSNPLTNNQFFEYVRTSGMVFDQLIFEAPNENNIPQWVHVAIRPASNRRAVMQMVRNESGEKEYQNWPWKGGSGVAAAWLVGLVAATLYYFTRAHS